jgi:hypothetical protein
MNIKSKLIKLGTILTLCIIYNFLSTDKAQAQTPTSTATATSTSTPTPTSTATPDPQHVYRKYYRDNGTATTSNYTVEFPFNPLTFTICNEEASGGVVLYYNYVTGLAASTNKSANGRLPAGLCHSFQLEDQDAMRQFNVGVLAASSTVAFMVYGTR